MATEHDPFNRRKYIFKQRIFQPALLIYHRVQIRGSFGGTVYPLSKKICGNKIKNDKNRPILRKTRLIFVNQKDLRCIMFQ